MAEANPGPSSANGQGKSNGFFNSFVNDYLSNHPEARDLVKLEEHDSQRFLRFNDIVRITDIYCDYKQDENGKKLKRKLKQRKDNFKNTLAQFEKKGLLKKVGSGTEFEKEYLKYEIKDGILWDSLKQNYSVEKNSHTLLDVDTQHSSGILATRYKGPNSYDRYLGTCASASNTDYSLEIAILDTARNNTYDAMDFDIDDLLNFNIAANHQDQHLPLSSRLSTPDFDFQDGSSDDLLSLNFNVAANHQDQHLSLSSRLSTPDFDFQDGSSDFSQSDDQQTYKTLGNFGSNIGEASSDTARLGKQMDVAMSCKKAKAEMDKHFSLVAYKIGRHWKTLGRELNIPVCIVDNIDADYKQPEEKAYQVLRKWYENNGQARATIESLGNALQAIGKMSIAEEIGFHDFRQVGRKREDCGRDKRPHQQTDSNNEKSAEPNPFPNGIMLEKLKEEADKMLEYCQDSIPGCDRHELGHILIVLEHIQALNKMMMEWTGSFLINDIDVPKIAEIKRNNRIRYAHTDKTIRLTTHLLYSLPKKQTSEVSYSHWEKSRSASEVLPRCTSIIIPLRRSYTSTVLSPNINISLPVSITRKYSRLLPADKPLRKNSTKSKLEMTQCGSCRFEEQTCVWEKEEISFDKYCSQRSNPDSMLYETTSCNEDGSHDSKLW